MSSIPQDGKEVVDAEGYQTHPECPQEVPHSPPRRKRSGEDAEQSEQDHRTVDDEICANQVVDSADERNVLRHATM